MQDPTCKYVVLNLVANFSCMCTTTLLYTRCTKFSTCKYLSTCNYKATSWCKDEQVPRYKCSGTSVKIVHQRTSIYLENLQAAVVKNNHVNTTNLHSNLWRNEADCIWENFLIFVLNSGQTPKFSQKCLKFILNQAPARY